MPLIMNLRPDLDQGLSDETKNSTKTVETTKVSPKTVPVTDFEIVFRVAPNYPKRLFN